MAKSYRHLTYDQRCQIFALKESGSFSSEIAKVIGVHRTTIFRELKRNSDTSGYHYQKAQEISLSRRSRPHNKKMFPTMIMIIEEKLLMDWSPEQISGWLKKNENISISHETIYKHIWQDKAKGGTLYKHLRHKGKKYNKRSGGSAGRGCIYNRVDIKERPAIVENKVRLGDWELDTIVGAKHKGAIVSMVDRTAKLTKLVKVNNKTAAEVRDALIKKLRPIRKFVFTLTSDNGKEFAYHQAVSRDIKADFFFATPYHSWERGLNEHTNGLVRQYFPKSTSFGDISEEDIERVEELLNNRPRKSLGYETPIEAFRRLSKASLSSR